MFRKTTMFALTGAVAALVFAPSAAADPNSFIEYLNTHGSRPALAFSDAPLIERGYLVCRMIEDGTPVEQVKGQFFGINTNTPAFVEAAQHELCPGTL